MLEQENQAETVESRAHNANNSNTNSNNNNVTTNGDCNNKLSNSSNSSLGSNPLNDHDYCSPNKNSFTANVAKEEKQIKAAVQPQSPELRGKRQRKEVHDPIFSNFSSSEYSSSDAESDPESEDEVYDEDDPDRPWCNCNKPDDGKFMIQCDACLYWFHGNCVGVVESLSKRFAREKKDWYCSDCEHAISSGTAKADIPPRIAKKEKKSSIKPGGKRRGRPRKSESTREASARLSQKGAKKSTSTLETRMSSRRSSTRSNVGSESFQEFEHPDRLKELIRERRKAFFKKHRLSEQLKAEKMKEMGVGQRSVTTSMGGSLDSLVAKTNSPNMNNLPINIKSETKDKSKPNIVLQINTKKEKSAETGSPRLVTTIVKKRKHSESADSNNSDLFTSNPIQIPKKNKKETVKSSPPKTSSAKTSASASPVPDDEKANISKSQKTSAKEQASVSQTKRKDSKTYPVNGPSAQADTKEMIRIMKESLETRVRHLGDYEISSEKLEQIATAILDQLDVCYTEGTPRYKNKFRSLLFNLKDPKNKALLINVLNGEIIPSRLVRMSHDDMASNELAKWRERENKHSLDLIKRDAEMAAEQVIVKKTHKGEEVISTSQLNDSENAAASDNQELPTTPTKTSIKLEANKPSVASNVARKIGTSTSMSDQLDKNVNAKKLAPVSSTALKTDPLSCLDTTKDHKSHVFDIGCKICTKQQTEIEAEEDATKATDDKTCIKNEPDQEKSPDQPKRLRISVDTKLDPANLERLREPLIKPAEKPNESTDYSPSRRSPNAAALSDHEIADDDDAADEEEDDLYDPETSTIPSLKTTNPGLHRTLTVDDNGPCWSGTIHMPDVAKFGAFVKPVSGRSDFIKNRISETLTVCGRIAPDQISSYVKIIKSTTKNQIILVQLHPLSDNDKASFDLLFDYLYTRNRCGVVSCSAHSHVLKDFYIMPIHEKSNIPEFLKPINGPGLDRSVPNCFLGLMLKAKRPPSANGSTSSYVPTPINK